MSETIESKPPDSCYWCGETNFEYAAWGSILYACESCGTINSGTEVQQ